MNRIIRIADIAILNQETYKKGSYPNVIKYLDTGSLTKNKIEKFQILDTKSDKIPSRAQRKVKLNTILYSNVRPIQEHYGIIERNSNDIVVSTGFTTIDIEDENIDPKYIYYLISQKNITDYLHTIGMNAVSSYPSISPDDLGNLKFKVPDFHTQKEISRVLSNLDSKVEINNNSIKVLNEYAKAIFDYWFLQFDFPNASGRPYKSSGGKMVFNSELKREIPDGWEVKTLSKITSVSNESLNPLLTPEKDFKHYSIPTFDTTKTYGVEKGIEIRSNKFKVAETDLLVSKLNPWFSRVIYPIKEDDLICSTEFVVWRTSDKNIKNFLFMVATGEHFIAHCTQSATGTSNSHKRVNPTVMMRYKIPYNADLIQKYGSTIDPFLMDIVSKRIENRHLTVLRDWLLPMLMNGQVTVKETEERISLAPEPSVKYGN